MSKLLPDIISFENKFFSASNGVIFFKNEFSGEPIMQIPIDKTAAELPFKGIRKELKLDDEDHDGGGGHGRVWVEPEREWQ